MWVGCALAFGTEVPQAESLAERVVWLLGAGLCLGLALLTAPRLPGARR